MLTREAIPGVEVSLMFVVPMSFALAGIVYLLAGSLDLLDGERLAVAAARPN